MKNNSKLSIRFTQDQDADYLKNWLQQPNVLQYFPMADLREIEDAVRIWVGYSKFQGGLTAEWEGVPCGMANLYLQYYKKLKHQCLFSIIVDEAYRGKGVGTALIQELIRHAKETFKIEILHLEVYEGNPAINLYRRMGFKEFGVHQHFIKEDGRYIAKIFMQKRLTE